MDNKPSPLTFLEPVPALPVTQGNSTFYLFAISAKKLLKISYTSERTQYNRKGIQRGLRPDRLREIGQFLESNSSDFPVLPNAIIISLSAESYYKNGKIHICNRPAGEAFVIDGQHRLWAFQEKYSGTTDFDVVVTAFINLKDAGKAFVFRSINGNQRKINPSLVYDLIPMLRDTEVVAFEDRRCHDLVILLNESANSPWADRISMVGSGDRIISQSSFITALKKLFKKGHLFANNDPDFFEERLQGDILIQFFNALQSHYSVEWDNKAYYLCKYVGVSSLITLLEKIIMDLRQKGTKISDGEGLCVNEREFTPYVKKLRAYAFSSSEAKTKGISYVGEGGVSELTKVVTKYVFGD